MELLNKFLIKPLKTIYQNKVGFIGFLIVIFYVLMAVIGPLFIPLDKSPKPELMYQPPTWEHPLGTDYEGRDILSQIVHGSRDVLYVAFLAGFLTVLIATLLGSFSGFKGGKWDFLIMAVADILLTIPQFPLLSVLAAVMRLDYTFLAVLISVLSWPTLARAIRSQVLSLKERDFIEAAKALDLGTRHIIFTEMMPNLMPYIAINFIFAMTGAIYTQVGLVFLGFVPFVSHNWGVMINIAWTKGAIFYKQSIYYILSPIMAIVGFQLGAILFSRSLEEIFNPRLREE